MDTSPACSHLWVALDEEEKGGEVEVVVMEE